MPSAARKSAPRPAPRSSPPRRLAAVQEGPLIINIGHQGDGCVYRLDLSSKRQLQGAHPRTHVVPTVLIGYTRRDEFEKVQGPMWPQIAQMITGIDAEKLKALGGVELYNWEDGWRRRIV